MLIHLTVDSHKVCTNQERKLKGSWYFLARVYAFRRKAEEWFGGRGAQLLFAVCQSGRYMVTSSCLACPAAVYPIVPCLVCKHGSRLITGLQ